MIRGGDYGKSKMAQGLVSRGLQSRDGQLAEPISYCSLGTVRAFIWDLKLQMPV